MEETKQEQGRGAQGGSASKRVQFRTLCAGMLAAACVLLAVLIGVAVYVSRRCQGTHELAEAYIAAEKNNLLLRNASDYLTDQARGYAATMDFRFVKDYYEELNVTQRRETAIEEMKGVYPNTPACTFMATAYRYSDDLVRQETYAMRLIAEASGEPEENWPEELQAVHLRSADQLLSSDEQAAAAIELVYGDPYSTTKTQIIQNLDYSMDELYYTMRDSMLANDSVLERAMWRQGVLFFLLFLLAAGAVVLLGALVVRPVQVYLEYLRAEKRIKTGGAFDLGRLTIQYENVQELTDAGRLMSGAESSRDPLTGLMNRNAFAHAKKMLGSKEKPVGLVLLNVNHMRSINEEFGYDAGDRVLQRVAALMTERFRATDSAAHLGGGEFALILPGIGVQHQDAILQKINSLNETLMHPKDGLPPASLSGGAAFSAAGFTEDLYQKASLALYEVRENGRSGCGVYAAAETPH